jgi:nucleoid DNA-binding protein
VGFLNSKPLVNVEAFKSQLAGTVVAKAGITSKQAKELIHYVLELPSRNIKKTLNLFGLGDVILINREATTEVRSASAASVKIPYEAVVQFNVGNELKKLTFHDLKGVRGRVRRYSQWGGFEDLITFGGLEGKPETKPRRLKKQRETEPTKQPATPAAPRKDKP